MANIGGKHIKIVDTPGLLDPQETTEDELEELANAILEVPNGIHALCLMIDVTKRIHKPDLKMLEQLLIFKELTPYAFVVFTHTKVLGSTDSEQKNELNRMLNDSCPEILTKVIQKSSGKYMVLESVDKMEQGYHTKKSLELLEHIESIFSQTSTHFMIEVAKALKKSNVGLKELV